MPAARTRRRLGMVVLPVALVLVGLALTVIRPTPAAQRPAAEPDAGGPPPAAPGQTTAQSISALQAAIRSRPRSAELYATLGLDYYQRVRETGDFSYYVKAEGVLRKALVLDPRSEDATVGMATVALARHDFAGGLRFARAALRLQPEGIRAYPGIVDGLVELGRYGEAEKAVQRFVDLRPALPSYARVSYFRELHGDLGGAVQAMRYAVSAGGEAPENVAYVQSLLGDLEVVRGRRGAARTAYHRALASVPRYVPADFGLAQLDAAERHLDPAIVALRSVVDRLPLPQYVVALGEAELVAGRPADARSDFAIIGAERRLLAASGVNTDADTALFEAGHGDARLAVGLGRRAWASAPSIRSADALGWALTRAGRPRAGLRWARRSLKLGSRDPLLLYHAGEAARLTGRRAEARADLRRSLALNPRFSAYYAPRAQRALAAVR